MKVMITGCNGQLGVALSETAPRKFDVVGLDLPDLDLRDAASIIANCIKVSPDFIVNAAAYTAVDKAESESTLAHEINVEGAKNLAVAANEIGARLVHVSTDFVFDGRETVPYRPDSDTNPLGVYGLTKRDGENAVLETRSSAAVIRTAWLYSRTGTNFVKTMLRLMGERDELRVVVDQKGSPTWANSLAAAIWRLTQMPGASGIFHWTDEGETSWHGFATAIQEDALSLGMLQRAIPIQAIRSQDYPTPAMRPAYSVLDCSTTRELLQLQPEPWRVNLRKVLQELSS